MTTFEVVLRRRNGRYVKSQQRRSKYAAKLLQNTWESQYDDGYYVEIHKMSSNQLLQ